MTNLVPVSALENVVFVPPEYMAVLEKPFGYYEFLGIPGDANRDAIDKADKRIAGQTLPDKGGNEVWNCNLLF